MKELAELRKLYHSTIMNETVVLVMCGSFNPVTNMHLRMMEIARDHLQHCGHIVQAGFVSPVHDSYPKDTLITIKHRAAMLRFALESSNWIKLSTWEGEQDGWTPTYDILLYHQDNIQKLMKSSNINRKNKLDINANPSHRPTVKLVCGADFLASFLIPNLWKSEHIELMLKKFGIVVITRTGYNISEIIDKHDILYKYMTRITHVNEFIENGISSTKIRQACSRNLSIKYLVHEKVEHYIKNHGLYCNYNNKCKSTEKSPSISSYFSNDTLNNSINIVNVASKKKFKNSSQPKKRKIEGSKSLSRNLKRSSNRKLN